MPPISFSTWRRPGGAVLVPVVLGMLTLLYMTPFLFPPTGNEVLSGHDLLDQQYPLLSFIFDSVRSGQGVPLWNPYQLSGESNIGNPQVLLFYPPAWLLVLLGVPKGVGWLVTLHLWLGAWGMAAFVRRLGANWAGALAGACVYTFSAVLAARLDAGHINYLFCQAWLPWAAAAYLWSTERAAAWWRALLTAAALGLAALSGSTHLFHLGAVWLGGLWLYVILQARPEERWRAAWRAFWPLALAGIGAAVLGAAVILPSGAMALRSARVAQSGLAYSDSFPLGGSQLMTLVLPNILGQPHLPDHGYWGLPFYEESAFYVGLLPLVALFLARPRPAKTWLAACLVVGLIVSLGTQGGLFTVLYWLLPGYRLFRVPPRALYFVAVGAAGLMALWLTDLQTTPRAERARHLAPALRWGLPGLGLFALLASFAFTFYYSVHSGDEAPPWRALYSGNMAGIAMLFVVAAWLTVKLWAAAVDDDSAPGPQAALVVTLGFILIDLWHISMPLVNVGAVDVPPLWQAITRVAPSTPDFRVMIANDTIAWQNGATYTRHLSTGGYEQLVDVHYMRLLNAAGRDPTSAVARLLGVRYAAHSAPLPDNPDLRLVVQEQGYYIYAVSNTFPRAFVAPAIQVLADDQAALAVLSSGKVDLMSTAVVDQPAGCPASTDAGVPAPIVSYTPNAVTVAVDSASGGVLVLSDAYDSDWKVSVDGQPAALLRVDVALRGVCVPPGAHRVEFTYHPRLFWLAALLSGGGWAVLCLAGLWGLARRLQARRAVGSRSDPA